MYPKNLLEREASAFHKQHVVQNRALGELDHPSPHSPTFRCLNSANVSHQVLDYHWSGDDLMGYVEVLPTQAGGMLRDLYIAGFQLGMSSRGWATLKEKDGYICIQDDFELITFDFVSDPSTEGAYLRPLQRTYERLRPPIDVDATYHAFMRNCKAGKAYLASRADEAPASPATPAPASPPAAPATMRAASDVGREQEHARVTPAATLVTCEDSRSKDDLRKGSDGVGKWLGPSSGSGSRPSSVGAASGRAAPSNGPARGTGTGTGKGTGGTGWTPPATPPRRGEDLNARARVESGGSWKSVFGGKRKNKVAPGDKKREVRTLRERWNELQSGRGEPPGGAA